MVACDCDRDAKVRFAEQLGIKTVWTRCGGEHECGEIFVKHSA